MLLVNFIRYGTVTRVPFPCYTTEYEYIMLSQLLLVAVLLSC